MSAAEELLDRSVSHQIGLQRLSGNVRDKLIAHMNRVEDDLLSKIRDRMEKGAFTDRRQRLVLRDVREILNDAQSDSLGIVRGELRELASYESEFQTRALQRSVPIEWDFAQPSREQLQKIVTSRPFQGKLLREWVEELSAAQRRQIRDSVRLGMTEGESVDQIVRRIRGTRARGFRDGVMETTRRQAEAMVRTAVNHTATASRDLLYEENSDIVKGWQFVATLDSRTTPECASLDGRTFDVGKGPRPPRHPNCRSTTTPVLKSWRELGIDIDEAPAGTRASMNGQVPDKTTYNDWLSRQDTQTQDEVLGKTKARLFRQGDLPMDRFVDPRGKTYTLDELRRRESEAFERAGLAD